MKALSVLILGGQDAYLAMHHSKARVRPIRMLLAEVTTSTKTFNRREFQINLTKISNRADL